MIILLLSIAIFLFIFYTVFSIQSFFEKQFRAVKLGVILAFVEPLPYLLLAFIPFPGREIVVVFVLSLLLITIIILLIPIKGNFKIENEIPSYQFDERNTMFSRNEITRDANKQKLYYEDHPENEEKDKDWQAKPGLMSEKSSMYSPLTFGAADASFYTIEMLRPYVNGNVNTVKKEFSDEKMTQFISNWAKKLGAVSVGFCEMQHYHYYSVRGRGENYGKEVKPIHKYGIAISIEMDKELLATGPAGPTLMESAQQYLNSGVIAIQIAKFIRDMGYDARAHIDGNYEVICPLVARDAGLGEIGRMGLLMTPELGPRVRLAVISTNIPLKINKRVPDYSLHHFCTLCKKCANICPAQAIPKTNMSVINGAQRWQINQEKCFGFWCSTGTDCGRCMSVCPYSHPNNMLHNFVRWGIKNNVVFRYVALYLDDFFYGKKPTPAKVPSWLSQGLLKKYE